MTPVWNFTESDYRTNVLNFASFEIWTRSNASSNYWLTAQSQIKAFNRPLNEVLLFEIAK